MTSTSIARSTTSKARRSALLMAALTTALVASAPSARAVTDPANDFLPTFGGSTSETDLDVLSASVTYSAATDSFILTSTMAGAVGTTASGLYVWGVNRGAGGAGFAANGLDDVLFDGVVLLRADGSGAVAGGPALSAGSVTVSGNTITGIVSASLLPSTGFAKQDYTWNLWPRDLAFSGFAQIADFAPDTTNLATTLAPVPEPSTYALMLAGLAVLVGGAQRRRGRTVRATVAV